MKIALLDPFYDDSHKHWAMGLKMHSSHDIEIVHQRPVHWKWKMTGGSIVMADDLNTSPREYDLLLATDMLNVPLFVSMLRPSLKLLPLVCYFHENQITYPWSSNDRDLKKKRDHHYGFINFSSALMAHKVVFNSSFHQNDFLNALPAFLSQFPSFQYGRMIDQIASKSIALSIGFNDVQVPNKRLDCPTFIWNHRWEYDKNPEIFFETLFELHDNAIAFKLIVLGKSFDVNPPIFEVARERLKEEIVHFGYAERDLYHKYLSQANILLVTSRQDFFGISVVEAIRAGCYPIIPDRLVYGEHIPEQLRSKVTYSNDKEILPLLREVIGNKLYRKTDQFEKFTEKYSWKNLIDQYDEELTNIVGK